MIEAKREDMGVRVKVSGSGETISIELEGLLKTLYNNKELRAWVTLAVLKLIDSIETTE